MTPNSTDEHEHEHEHIFPEEQEPNGRLILAPCLTCNLTALDAIAEVKKRLALVEAVVNRGTGHDLNPTVLNGYGPVRTGGWVGYLNELDRTWRDRIRSALNGEDPTALAEAQLEQLRAERAQREGVKYGCTLDIGCMRGGGHSQHCEDWNRARGATP